MIKSEQKENNTSLGDEGFEYKYTLSIIMTIFAPRLTMGISKRQ